ncbi:hypothetical protein BCR44DRAFT_1428327 [Catenaria anguillulae PL171]|uniref:Uncharacterized protein n=1 Tax=Catenaria anguillulae PL171 TaxID=765915 RepID=A0A1Y2HV45_9FUNG|nr:hypothetical protein BCR44DRAFT_1428327 [Catenaria anguillulae PL171]
MSHAQAQDEPASLASLFIKSATWPWSLMQVAELVSLMDCTLHWREAYFTAFTNHYLAHIERDLPFYSDSTNHALPDTTHGLPLRASPMSAFSAHAAPAAVVLARDKPTRILFLATLYRTSLAVQQFRLDAMLAGLSGVGVGALVEQAAVDVLGACEEVRLREAREDGNGSSESADGDLEEFAQLGSERVSLGSLARLVADAGLLNGSPAVSSASVRDEAERAADRDVRQERETAE